MKTLKLLTLFALFFTLIACEKEEETDDEQEAEEERC